VQRALRVKILVVAVEEAHNVLGRAGQFEHPLAHGEGDGAILHAVQDQHRGGDFSDRFVGAELILHQEAHRQIPIVRGGDRGRRRERRFQDHAADRLFRRDSHRDRGAERLAPEHDLFGRIMRRGKRVTGFAIGDQAGFGRHTRITAEAPILDRDQAETRAAELAEALDAIAQGAAIAVEINNNRFVVARRDMPGDGAPAVGSRQHHFGGLRQTGLRRRRVGRVREIHH